MRNFKTEGIVIKRRNYGEADRIITLYTREHGKLHIKATGVRKITSRRSPHVELLNLTEINVHKGRAYPILIEAQVTKDFSDIKVDLNKVGLAYHLCELIDGLCPEGEVYEPVFNLLFNTLNKLGEAEEVANNNNLNILIHEFEVELLSILGFWHGNPEMSAKLDTDNFIENLLEKRLKSKRIFSKMD